MNIRPEVAFEHPLAAPRESTAIAANPSHPRDFGHSCPKWSAFSAAVGNALKKRSPRCAGTSSDGARRIRTADLLGAIRGGGQGDLRKKGLICREFRFFRGSPSEQFSRQICADMQRCDRSRELLARSSRNRGGRFNVVDLLANLTQRSQDRILPPAFVARRRLRLGPVVSIAFYSCGVVPDLASRDMPAYSQNMASTAGSFLLSRRQQYSYSSRRSRK
jgi:hypothetical protein